MVPQISTGDYSTANIIKGGNSRTSRNLGNSKYRINRNFSVNGPSSLTAAASYSIGGTTRNNNSQNKVIDNKSNPIKLNMIMQPSSIILEMQETRNSKIKTKKIHNSEFSTNNL
jgi:hypothetical protein